MPTSRKMIARKVKGMALVTCTIILLGMALISMAAQQIVGDASASAFNVIDRQFAFQSAEAALADARQALFLLSDAAVTSHVQTYGALTGNTLPHGDGLQIHQLPGFQISKNRLVFMQDQTDPDRYFYRVTAAAVGLRSTTQVFLQADFIKPLCHSSGQCMPSDYTRLAWRMLNTLPAGWRVDDATR